MKNISQKPDKSWRDYSHRWLINIIDPWINMFKLLIKHMLYRLVIFIFPSFDSEHQKLSSRARKDIIVNQIIPALNRIGFEKPPFPADYGWEPAAQGYCYDLVRLHADELQLLEFRSYYKWCRIEIHIYICRLSPIPDNLTELSDSCIWNFHHYNLEVLGCEDWRLFYYPYNLKFRNKERLEKKKNKLAKKIIKYLYSDKPIKYWRSHRTTDICDWNGNVLNK